MGCASQQATLGTVVCGPSSGPCRAYDFFVLGIFAPDRRASLRAIATACLRLFTFLPLPDFNWPCLCSFMTLWILRLPFEPEREPECDEDFVAMVPRYRLAWARSPFEARPAVALLAVLRAAGGLRRDAAAGESPLPLAFATMACSASDGMPSALSCLLRSSILWPSASKSISRSLALGSISPSSSLM